MPFHADNPVIAVRMKETNHLMRFAMRRNPEEYYDFISKPRLQHLGEVAWLRTAAEYAQEFDAESDAMDLFEAAINDLIPPFSAITREQPDLTKDQALAIMSNGVTVATYGILASMGEGRLHRLYDENKRNFVLSSDEAAIVLAHPPKPLPYDGCLAVDAKSGHPEMTPVFKQFVPWAGSLAVIAHFEYR